MTSYISGIQQVSITIANGATSGTATISAATGTGILVKQGSTSGLAGTNPARAATRLEYTNSTTITAYRNTADAATCTVNATVVDAKSDLVSSVQYGTINTSTGSGTATISAVTTNNTAHQELGYTTTATSQSPIGEWGVLDRTNTTTVTLTCGTSGTNVTYGFCAIDFNGSALNQTVQAVSNAAAPSGVTRTATITSAALNDTWNVYAGIQTNGGANPNSGLQTILQTAATTLTFRTSSAPFVNIRANCYVTTFVSGVLSQAAQRGEISLSAATSGTATITSSATASTLANFTGNTTSGSNHNVTKYRLTQTNATTLTTNVNSSATGRCAWEALNFTAGGTAYTMPTDTDAYAITGTAIPLLKASEVAADSGSYAITGTDITFRHNYPISADGGAYDITGTDISLENNAKIATLGAAYVITGTAINLERNSVIAADGGTYTINGTDISLVKAYPLAADGGSYAITGTDISLEQSRRLDVGVGAYAIAGTAISLENNAEIAADGGAYNITGTNISLELHIAMNTVGGAYALSGTDISLEASRIFSADTAAYTITGTNISLENNAKIAADSGSYDITGTDISLFAGKSLVAEGGAYDITGADAGLLIGVSISAEGGGYAIAGQDAEFLKNIIMLAESGEYTTLGASIDLTHSDGTQPQQVVSEAASGRPRRREIVRPQQREKQNIDWRKIETDRRAALDKAVRRALGYVVDEPVAEEMAAEVDLPDIGDVFKEMPHIPTHELELLLLSQYI